MNMTHRLAQLSVLGIFLGAGSAYGQRICILDFPGPGGATVRKQLAGQLCDAADCVGPHQVTTRGKPDAKKARREMLQYYVAGAMKKGRAVDLSVLAVGKANALARKSFPLERGQLSARNLRAAADFVRGAAGGGALAPAPVPVAEASSPPDLPPAEPAQALPAPSSSAEAEPTSSNTAPDESPTSVSSSEASSGSSSRKPLILALELGTDVLNRHFGYDNATSGNLRQYDLALFPLPAIHAELYPFALAGLDALSALGIEASFAYAPFLKSRRASGTDSYPTAAMKMDVGLRWRFMPLSNFALAITPYAGMRIQSFKLAAASTGEMLDGLPNLEFVGARVGAALEVPVAQDAVIILARIGVLPLFSAGEIISRTYFAQGSGFGLEGSVGLAVQLAAFAQIRATFEYTQYSLSFKASSSDLYAASGAVDRYLGGNLAVRLQF